MCSTFTHSFHVFLPLFLLFVPSTWNFLHACRHPVTFTLYVPHAHTILDAHGVFKVVHTYLKIQNRKTLENTQFLQLVTSFIELQFSAFIYNPNPNQKHFIYQRFNIVSFYINMQYPRVVAERGDGLVIGRLRSRPLVLTRKITHP